MIDIRLPNITAGTAEGQLRQIQSYLIQFAQQMQYAMNTMETGGFAAEEPRNTGRGNRQESQEEKAQNSFAEIKSLIIKSADIVHAYYEEIDSLLKLSGEYAAEAHFPDGSASFVEHTTAQFGANSSRIQALFTDTQTIQSNVDAINSAISSDGDTTTILSTNAWAKIGKIGEKESGHYIYGMEIGQTDEVNGAVVYRKYARYTSDGVYLYDGDGIECARLANGQLIATKARLSVLQMGGFQTIVNLEDGSVVKKWVGWPAE